MNKDTEQKFDKGLAEWLDSVDPEIYKQGITNIEPIDNTSK
jgi:hypothetical protein